MSFMQIRHSLIKNTLYISLMGEMDECSSQSARKECDILLDEHPSVKQMIINLSEVTFMDSTGIGFLIGRYKKASRLGVAVYVQKPNLAADKVLTLSGVYALIPKVD
jgi:stage II sporulation protein AA (anti-sigma F factor antagonist)